MGAIKVIHTKTTDTAWDGGAATKNLKADQGEAYYRQEFAWQDPDGDATKKGSYKFPHHEVDGDGAIGAANVKACQSIISILNGGMGGANIPEGDRKGVYNHAAAHLKDAGEEPAELKATELPQGAEAASKNTNIERRFTAGQMRAAEQDGHPVIEGLAAVYDQETNIGGWFREVIQRGAFKSILATNPDVVADNNHDLAQVLGRTRNGTLQLWEDDQGLHYRASINEKDPEAMSLYAKVQRGDIDQSSFMFEVDPDEGDKVEQPDKTMLPLRTIMAFSALYDVSPVTFPAYPQTSAGVRSKLQEFNQDGHSGAVPLPIEQPSGDQAVAEVAERSHLQAQMAMRRRKLALLELEIS